MNLLMVAIGGRSQASSRLRVHDWVPYLRKAGVESRIVEVHPTVPRGGAVRRQYLYATQRRTAWSAIEANLGWADSVFVQEALLPSSLLQKIRAQCNRLAFDFSDPVHLTSTNQWWKKIAHRVRGEPRFEAMLKAADTVVVENDRIAETIASRAREVRVMRGPIDVHKYRPDPTLDRPANAIRLGWTGSPGTYGYFTPVFPALDAAWSEDKRLELALIGAPNDAALPAIPTSIIPWSEQTEPREVARFDIGLSFHPENSWTRARGGGKLILYMAAGIPVISSHFGIGDQVVKPGVTGLLARTPEEWVTAIRTLAHNAEGRRKMAEAARAIATTEYSYEAYLPLMLHVTGAAPGI